MTPGLTRGRVVLLIRLAGLVSVLLALGGMLLLWAPLPEQPALRAVAQATTRQNGHSDLVFPKYSELTAARPTPFEFSELALTEVKVRGQEPASAPSSAEQAPPPQPDVAGLALVGTAPGSRRAFAVLQDQQSGLTTTVARGDKLRNAVVKDIQPDRIVLALAEQQAELTLVTIQGGQNLAQQPPAAQPPPAARTPPEPIPVAQPPPRSLGISGHMLSLAKQQELGLQQTGLLVTAVQRSDSTVQVGDVLIAIAGQNFSSIGEALTIIQAVQGTTIPLQVFRNGSTTQVNATLN